MVDIEKTAEEKAAAEVKKGYLRLMRHHHGIILLLATSVGCLILIDASKWWTVANVVLIMLFWKWLRSHRQAMREYEEGHEKYLCQYLAHF